MKKKKKKKKNTCAPTFASPWIILSQVLKASSGSPHLICLDFGK